MNFIRRIQYLLRARRMEQDLAEEMEFHRVLVQKDLEDRGLPAGQAEMAGRRAMGASTQMREEARAVWIWPWLESVWQDTTYAARSLRRKPLFALVAILVLSCAIGLNTSLFTVFNAVALRPWPVPEPQRVVRVFGFDRHPLAGTDPYRGFSVQEYRFLAERAKSLAGLIFERGQGGVQVEQRKVRASFVSGNYFQVLGVGMERGRGFLTSEDRLEGPEAVTVLSYLAWKDRFGGDPDIIGRRLQIQDSSFLVVGVAPANFGGTAPERTDAWIPLASMAILYPGDSWAHQFLSNANNCCGDIAGRLAPGISREQARAELSLLVKDYAVQRKESSDGVVLTSTPLLQQPGKGTGQVSAIFGMMFAGVLLVLLLACANVGNLLLARGEARRREIAVRASLGAGRARVVRQLMTESLVLAVVAGAFGVALAWFLPGPIFRASVGEVSLRLEPNSTVLAFTLGLAALACVVCGLAPALAVTGTQRRHWLRGSLLAAQVSSSVILLVCAGLLIRGIQHARSADPGFDVRNAASVTIDLPAAYAQPETRKLFQMVAQRLEALPGVPPFGWSNIEPLGNSIENTSFRLPGESEKQEKLILMTEVSGGYFGALGIHLAAGRTFTEADSSSGPMLVNEAMARKYFPNGDAVGKSILQGKPRPIVGIVKDAHTSGLEAVQPMIYQQVSYGSAPHLMIRNTPDMLAKVKALVESLEPRARVTSTPLQVKLDQWLSNSRIGAMIAGMLGILALALAAVGIAGVFAFAVEQRRREIGIRMALGARPAQVIGPVFRSAARSLLVGLALGIAGALLASSLLRQYIFGISHLDAVTYLSVLATLAFAGMAATWLPARRAIRVDPIACLRQD